MLISVLMMVSATFIAVFAANYGVLQQRVSANSTRALHAFEAAEAGLEFGISYLNQNSAAILAGPVNGYIQPYSSTSTQNVALPNGSKFTISYSNPVQNNYNLILVSSVGTNKDGTATRTVSQEVEFGSLLYISPKNTLTEINNVTMSNSAVLKNFFGNITIKSGGNTTLTGSATTVLSTGTSSTASSMGSDIQQNITSLANTSSSDFVSSYFGITPLAAKSKANYYFSNLGDYSSVLNGITGAIIWIDQTSGTAFIHNSIQVGTTSSPVILFVNGNLSMYGSVTVTGLVVLLGTSTSTLSQGANVNGSILSFGSLSLTGSNQVNYNNSVISTLQNSLNTYYAKVPGTWKDF